MAMAAASFHPESSEMPVKKPLNTYAEELRQWLYLTRQAQLFNSYHSHMTMSSCLDPRNTMRDLNSNIVQNQSQQSNNNVPNRPNIAGAPPPRTFPLSAGTEVRIPSVAKRCVAEIIDFVVLLMVKFFISYIFMTFLGLTALEILDFDYALISGELDIDKFFSLSSEILLVEMVHRVLVSFYEAFCLAYVRDVIQPTNVGGFTPGKKIMGICVVACDEVFSLGNDRFLVIQIAHPKFSKTLMRSLIKNFSVTLLVPSCLSVFMFDHHRTVYDIVAHTVVVEQDYGAVIANRR